MTNDTMNTLRYTGIVTLYQYIGSKKIEVAKIHNAGAYPLFNFFSDCLLGDFDIAKANRPTKIMLLNTFETEDGKKDYEDRSGFIYLTTKPEKVYSTDDAISTVRYSFMVTRDKLDGNTFSHIGLYSNSTTSSDYRNFAAICDADLENTTATMSSTSALFVDWELKISNR